MDDTKKRSQKEQREDIKERVQKLQQLKKGMAAEISREYLHQMLWAAERSGATDQGKWWTQ